MIEGLIDSGNIGLAQSKLKNKKMGNSGRNGTFFVKVMIFTTSYLIFAFFDLKFEFDMQKSIRIRSEFFFNALFKAKSP